MITASEVSKELNIPLWAVYRMADDGRIPYIESKREVWHRQRQLRFRLSDVKAAVDKLGPPRS